MGFFFFFGDVEFVKIPSGFVEDQTKRESRMRDRTQLATHKGTIPTTIQLAHSYLTVSYISLIWLANLVRAA